MKVLHYALGFPPYRTGGMTKFCIDLMKQQNIKGYQTALMWPGQMGFILKKISVKDRGNVCLEEGIYIRNFELINPLPVPYDEGINKFSEFMKDGGKEAYLKFLDDYKPNIIHVHTLMGLHKSFLEVAKEKKIRLVFTAHDFFPICPKVTMFWRGEICSSAKSCVECELCNSTALEIKKIQILQSPFYRALKDSIFVKKLRKKHRNSYLKESSFHKMKKVIGKADDFKILRNYYYSILKLMDIVHYNSTVTKSVYESFFTFDNSYVINITHADISDYRKIKNFSESGLKIRYLGTCSMAKGFFILKEALDKLWNERHDFCLDIHFTPDELSPYIKIHNKYTYAELGKIFDNTDVLVAPSIWKETFGYTVLEALSYGVPVIISETVGAKDILVNGAGIVIDGIDCDKLYKVFQNLTAEKLEIMNKLIVKNQPIITLLDMTEQIEEICYLCK